MTKTEYRKFNDRLSKKPGAFDTQILIYRLSKAKLVMKMEILYTALVITKVSLTFICSTQHVSI